MSESVTAADASADEQGWLGRVLDGRFRIEDKLGEGGLGTVFRASQIRVGRPVAVKVLHQKCAEDRTLRGRFEREARSLGALQHPAIVNVLDYGIDGSTPYLVMELLEGRALDRAIAEGISYEQAMAAFRSVVAAVAFAHERGVIHRDLKPANVFLQRTPDGQDVPRVLDFGLAKFTDDDPKRTALTHAGMVMGTPAYMSPEQVSGAPTDATTDVYSLGIMLYELLTGKRPFSGELSDLLRQHLLESLPPLSAVRPGLPRAAALDALLAKATAKSRKQRLADARALLAELDRFLAAEPSGTAATLLAVSPPPAPASAQTTAASAPATVAKATTVARKPRRAADGPPDTEPAGSPTERALPGEPLDRHARHELPLANTEAAGSPRTAEADLPPLEAVIGHPLRRWVAIGATAALLFGLGATALLLQAQEGPTVTAASTAASRPQPAPEPSAAPQPEPEPEDERAGEAPADLLADLPAALEQVRQRQRPGHRLSKKTRRRLLQWQRAHPQDPRGWLLMADLDMQWGARSDALRWYGKALAAAPDAERSASMRHNIAVMAAHGKVGRKAQRMLRERWGARSAPWIEAVVREENLGKDERKRLERFRASLEKQP